MKTTYLALFAVAILLASCCDPKPRNSYPQVVDSSYKYLAVRDAMLPVPPDNIVDSGYYPVYSFDITNTGSEADTFKLVIAPQYNGAYVTDPTYSLFDAHYVKPGETATFRTYGPIPSNALDTSKYRYAFLFFSTPDSLNLSVIRPLVQILYGSSVDGPETCGMPATSLTVNVDSLGKK